MAVETTRANTTRARIRAVAEYLSLAFWPLWALVLILQLLDVGSVALAFAAGAHVHEVNPVVLALAAHRGLLAAMLVKFGAVACWLALVLGLWLLCRRYEWRVGTVGCTLLVAVAGTFSAWVFWANFAAVFFGR